MTAPWKHSRKVQNNARKQAERDRRRNQRKAALEPSQMGYDLSPNHWMRPIMFHDTSVIASSGGGGILFSLDALRDLSDLPIRQQVEPIVGWKRARLMRHADGPVQFFGATIDASYGADATASCHRSDGNYSIMVGSAVAERPARHDHGAPGLDCHCGFYAVVDQDHWEVLRNDYPDGFARLEVELYGKVIRYSKGYRAEKQRVLAAWVDPVCFGCAMWGQYGITRHTVGGMAGMVNAHGILRPVCAQCAIGLAPKLLLSLADISSDLGTEVRWWE